MLTLGISLTKDNYEDISHGKPVGVINRCNEQSRNVKNVKVLKSALLRAFVPKVAVSLFCHF